ncbi:hypothetical protein [Streptomyces sp. NPDC058701]|uniref:hypothetical protein n=1 Tax=Streptomyces sp. NPDC058701 TaxID=3346608 RepID=UPI0036684FA8
MEYVRSAGPKGSEDMEIREVVYAVMVRRLKEHLEAPRGMVPRIYAPASEVELSDLGQFCEQPLEVSYRNFLATTNGMDYFESDLSAFSSGDWPDSVRVVEACEFAATLRDIGILQDVGLPQNAELFPVAFDDDSTIGIFMIDVEGVGERFWMVGNGDSIFFTKFSEILSYFLDPLAGAFRSAV